MRTRSSTATDPGRGQKQCGGSPVRSDHPALSQRSKRGLMPSGRTVACVIRPQSHPAATGPVNHCREPISCQSARRPDPSWCLLHELVHAMTSQADGRSDGQGRCSHGSTFRCLDATMRSLSGLKRMLPTDTALIFAGIGLISVGFPLIFVVPVRIRCLLNSIGCGFHPLIFTVHTNN